MTKLIGYLGRLLGFTRTGSSLIGKRAIGIISQHGTKRALGVVIIALLTATFLIHNFSNMGGALAFNAALANDASKVAVETRTTTTVQSPIDFSYESRGFSWYHSGADLVAPTGTPVYPIMEGTVEAVNHDYLGFGNHVIVKHDEGYESLYGHMSKTEVSEGQKVNLKTELGLSGSTGFSTGPHLHLEIHQNGQLVNPADLVPGVK